MLFDFVAPPLLKIDAFLVSALAGTDQIGNVVDAVDGAHKSRSGLDVHRFTTSHRPLWHGLRSAKHWAVIWGVEICFGAA